MQGLTLTLDEQGNYLQLHIDPEEVSTKLDTKSIFTFVKASQYGDFFLFEDNIHNAVDAYRQAKKVNSSKTIAEAIAERRNAEVKITLSEDDMLASIAIVTAYGGKNPSAKTLKAEAKQAGILRGLSNKRLAALAEDVKNQAPGTHIDSIIAKGLPPRKGKSSRLLPLVPNALDRILRPQNKDGSRVDMRNLGDVICVKIGTEVLRRKPPTNGRNGYTVTGVNVEAKAGDWLNLSPGEGTRVSDHDENLLVADITGMPKFRDERMWVDDVFVCSGVNVGSGNINYAGSVLVNGDVTEKMSIIAKGDVTINGFVESATIEAGGDIIITEGAMGKVNDANTDYSTHLTAHGNVHVQHGQGLDINSGGNVTIGRQLAYSKVNCGGGLTVGTIDNPNGNLFACEIHSQDQVIAGTLGAASGSSLSIDFSSGFSVLLERKDSLDELLQQVKSNNNRHKDKIDLLRSKTIPRELKDKFDSVVNLFNNEAQLMSWMQTKTEKMKALRELYQEDIKLIANKRLYPGVVVKLNNRTWRAEREYAKAMIHYKEHQWHYEPLI